MILNQSEHLQKSINYRLSDAGHLSSNAKNDYIKEEITKKDEWANKLQSEVLQNNSREIYKCEEAYQLFGEEREQKTSEIYTIAEMQNGFTEGPMLISALLGPCVQDDFSTVYKLIKHEDMIKDEVDSIGHSADLQHMLVRNIYDKQENVQNCDVENRVKQESDDPQIGDNHFKKAILDQCMKTNCKNKLCKIHISKNTTKKSSRSVQQNRNCKCEKSFRCRICRLSSVERFGLAQATLVRRSKPHTELKIFNCGLCNYSASRKTTLVGHIRTHTGDKPFKCKLCNYSASRKSTLARHNRIHTGERSFKCKICEYSTPQKYHLRLHISTHTREKTFKCELCDYSALERRSLVRHIRAHTGAKPFKCEICDFCASEKFRLVRHMRTHTREKPFKCELCDYSASERKGL